MRRTGIPSVALVKLAEAGAFQPSIDLARREALWAIKALRDEPLFAAAAAREAIIVPEQVEPAFSLRPMTVGGRRSRTTAISALRRANIPSLSSGQTCRADASLPIKASNPKT